MPVETPPYINSFNSLWPQDADTVFEGAAHIRNMKIALKASFPNVTAPVTSTHTVLNGLDARATLLESNRARKDIGDTFAGAMVFSSTIAATGAISTASTVTATGAISSSATVNGAAGVHQAGALLVPPGVMFEYGAASAPTGYLLCDGTAVSRATYAALFAVISTTFGVGDGSTTFNVPNRVNRYGVGAGTVALGATAGSATPAVVVAAGGTHTPTGVAILGGSHSHGAVTGATVLTTAMMPSHTHGVTDPGHVHTIPGGAANHVGGTTTFATPGAGGLGIVYDTNANTTGISIVSAGSDNAHSHTITADSGHTHTVTMAVVADHTHTASIADGRPPSLGVTYIIKT